MKSRGKTLEIKISFNGGLCLTCSIVFEVLLAKPGPGYHTWKIKKGWRQIKITKYQNSMTR